MLTTIKKAVVALALGWAAGGAAQAQTPTAAASTSALALQARSLAATCANCHGTDGRVKGDAVRGLAGVPAAVIEQAMKDFKTGARTGTIMHQIAKGYTDEQVGLIAGYFAAQSK